MKKIILQLCKHPLHGCDLTQLLGGKESMVLHYDLEICTSPKYNRSLQKLFDNEEQLGEIHLA